jgi:hypothetical protein
VQPALERPRFRNDLVAQPLEEEGVLYVDVTDPHSGNTFRFYDVEYSIACAMDGQRSLDALAQWTASELGIETTSDELTNVVKTLAELGYLEGEGEAAPAHAADSGLELGPPGRSPLEEPAPPPPAAEPVELGPPGAIFGGAAAGAPRIEPGQAAQELEDLDLEEMKEPAGRHATAPPPLPSDIAVKPEEETSFAGLLDEEEAAAAAAAAASAREVSMVADEPPHPLDDEDPTKLPRPMMAPPDEEPDEIETDMRVDLSAHLTVSKQEVAEAVRSSRVHAVPELPKDVRFDDEAPKSADEARPAIVASISPSATTPVPDRLPERPAGATTLPDRPSLRPSRPLAPIEPSRVPPAIRPPERRRSSMGLWIAIILLLAAGAAVLIVFKDAIFGSDHYSSRKPTQVQDVPSPPTHEPVASPPKPETTAEPKPETRPEAPPEPKTPPAMAATVRAEGGGAGEVKAPAEGQIVWVADEGATVAAGAPVAKYQGAKKEEAKLVEGQQRGEYYAKVLAEAEKANDEDKAGIAKAKVEEKKRMVEEATAALENLVVKAPSAGKVAKASRPRAVKAGDVLVEMGGEGEKVLRATFDAGDAAGKFASGAEVSLSAKSAPDKPISAVVESAADGKVTVRIPAGVAAGEEVLLPAPK